jgi:hypothetical protein
VASAGSVRFGVPAACSGYETCRSMRTPDPKKLSDNRIGDDGEQREQFAQRTARQLRVATSAILTFSN